MNLSNQDLKLLAKRILKKNLTQITGISSVFLVVFLLLGFVTNYLASIANNYALLFINFLITFILTLFFNVFTVGYLYSLLNLIRQKESSEPPATDLLYAFKTCPDRVIAITILTDMLKFVWLIPAIVFLILYYITGYQQELYVVLFMASMLIGLIICCFVSLSFSQCLFLIAENPSITIMNALKSSRQIMKGQKGNLLYLYLSFLGLFLLGVFTMYLGFFIILPYFYLTLSFFYLDITQQITRKTL